uniref:Uncharacterized protein n=2 Tax=uncultured bacterium contig00074 TaxID=1181553 RepID=A0A806K1T6_9BACT|nr:hypothetical protein [uncultured bacterium contig00074]
MDTTFASADVILCDMTGRKSVVSLEPGQLEVVVRLIYGGKPKDLQIPETDDPLFDVETFKMDPYFTPEVQADLRALKADALAGRNFVDHDPIAKRAAEQANV